MINIFCQKDTLTLDALFIERFFIWESKVSKSERYNKIITYICSSNLRLLGYYTSSPKTEIEEKAIIMFKSIFSDRNFIEQIKDLNISLNLFFPKWFIKEKKKILVESIIKSYFVNEESKRKPIEKKIKYMFKKYDYIWIFFMIKYYKNYLS